MWIIVVGAWVQICYGPHQMMSFVNKLFLELTLSYHITPRRLARGSRSLTCTRLRSAGEYHILSWPKNFTATCDHRKPYESYDTIPQYSITETDK